MATKTKAKAKAKKKDKAKTRKTRQVADMSLSPNQVKQLKKRLYELREEKGVTRAELAEKLGLSPSYFYQMENPNIGHFVGMGAMFRISRALKVTPALFLKGIK